ncbi:hypothetical protein D3C81_2000350 [compost metagenome]
MSAPTTSLYITLPYTTSPLATLTKSLLAVGTSSTMVMTMVLVVELPSESCTW